MSVLLKNLVAGEWVAGTGAGVALIDPVLGDELARVSSSGVDLAKGFGFARDVGGSALSALTYGDVAPAGAKSWEDCERWDSSIAAVPCRPTPPRKICSNGEPSHGLK